MHIGIGSHFQIYQFQLVASIQKRLPNRQAIIIPIITLMVRTPTINMQKYIYASLTTPKLMPT